MMNANHLHAWASSQLSTHTPFADVTAWWIVEHFSAQKKAYLIAHNPELTRDMCESVKVAVKEYCADHKPLGYILGSVPFADLTINVVPPLLIPRSETEEWVEWVITELKEYKKETLRILDLCTGTGCIALALAQAFPNAEIIGVDINPVAIEAAQKNAATNNILNARFILSDVFSAVEGQTFDVIVSNPPYIDLEEWKTLAPSVKNWEDPAALVAPHKGLFFYEKITAQAPSFLKTDSIVKNAPRLIVEIGYQQNESVTALFEAQGYKNVAAHKDINENWRWVSAELKT